ncbi:nuclear transport factor 2 family protein [Spirosoma sp. BT704]|uniref:Nuclear transport factor 2 family protein n=2 Tax=Spirosoma validum TaxID=2771355 RepID=A0A927B0E6_9BACT|nr:nuclear transport factor 2 family protein [Spirosoma validum]
MAIFSKGAETMGDLYTSDAKIYPPGGDTISGNTAIGEFWKGAYGMGIKAAKLDTVEAEPAGDQIVEVGNYTLYGDGNAELDKGKYIVVWKQDGEAWKLHRDIWNTSMPGQ